MSQFSNFTHDNTTTFCFICDNKLKTFPKCDISKSSKQIYHRFQSIVSRYLNLNMKEARKTLGVANLSLQWDKLNCCESCFEVVKKVCEIYEQWKNLQLQLNWNLNKIGDMMERSSKCDRNLIYNRTDESNFTQDFKINLESMKRKEYPDLILEKLKMSDDHEHQLQNQTVFVKLENDENEGSFLPDNHNDLDEMDTMDFKINNHIDISCVIKPEITVKVKPEIRMQGDGEKRKKKNRFPITENDERNLKKIACLICNKRFCSTGDLNRHARIHTGEKPFPCRICGKRFSRKDVRKRHEMAHKPGSVLKTSKLSCTFCSKKLRTNQHRIRHEWTHTGLKPFQCSVCERRFNDLRSVTRHIALRHKNVEDAKVVKHFNSYQEFE